MTKAKDKTKKAPSGGPETTENKVPLDPSIRHIAALLDMAKRIIAKGPEVEKAFIDGCKNNDACLIVASAAATNYFSVFKREHHLYPEHEHEDGKDIDIQYVTGAADRTRARKPVGNDRC